MNQQSFHSFISLNHYIMKKHIFLLILLIGVLSRSQAQKEKLRLENYTIIPKLGVSRSLGLNDLNDEFAWYGYTQVPIIAATVGVEANAQLGNVGLGIDYHVFSYSTEIRDILTPNSGSRSTSTVSGSDFSFVLGFDVLRKSQRHRLEPVLGIGYRSTQFSMLLRDTSMTFNQVLGGQTNAYIEQEKLGFLLSPGLRFIEHSAKGMDYNVEVGFRWMASQFNWEAHNLPLMSLSGINIRLGVVINLSELVGKKEGTNK